MKTEFKKETIKNARAYIKRKEKEGYYGDSLLPRLLLVVIDELEKPNKKRLSKREQSEWQRFVGEMLKKGMSMTKIAELWREKGKEK
jgi:hypothetical protein